jgi:hypothetical protein
MAKIKDVDAHRTSDMARCADAYLNLTLCPGGRPMVRGLICPHCDMDTTEGDCGGVQSFVKKKKVETGT